MCASKRSCGPCQSSVDYGNTKTPSMHSRLGSSTLSQMAFPRGDNPNFPWGKFHWENTVAKSKKQQQQQQTKTKQNKTTTTKVNKHKNNSVLLKCLCFGCNPYAQRFVGQNRYFQQITRLEIVCDIDTVSKLRYRLTAIKKTNKFYSLIIS